MAAVLALGGAMAVMSSNVALAQELAPAASIAAALSTAPAADVALVKGAKLSDGAIEALMKDPVLREKAHQLPSSVATVYGSFNANQKGVIARLLSGTTRVMLIPINNREAFVNGKVAGQDAFPHMIDKIQEEVKKRRLTPAEGEEMKGAMGQLKALTPAQRDTVAQIIHFDQMK